MRKKFIHSFILLFISLTISNVIIAKSNRPVPGLSLKQIKEIINTASGERALNHIRHLTLHHRWFVSDGYHEAALYIQKKAKEIGRVLRSSKKIVHDYYSGLCKRKAKKINSIVMTEEEKSANQLIPIRNPAFPGPISSDYIEEKLKEKNLIYLNLFTRLQLYEIGAFINGKRSVLDIRNAVSAECGTIKLSDVLAYLKMLEKIDLVSFK